MMSNGPRDAQTVPVHLQVVDLDAQSLTLTLPAYLPASDLSQRVARDAELEAFWPDRSRRIYYLRGRGRLIQPTERLQDLGVVPYELLHVLPEPPEGSGIEERPPEYPPNKGYSGAGNGPIAIGMAGLFAWTVMWALGLTVQQSALTSLLPGLGLALLCTSLARHLWGGLGSSVKIPVTAVIIYGLLGVVALVPAVVAGVPFDALGWTLGMIPIAGVIGILLGWLAWYGAVEPLPKVTRREMETAVANVTFPCGICGGQVTQDVKADCGFGCGRVFHVGCYEARIALQQGNNCGVCGYSPA